MKDFRQFRRMIEIAIGALGALVFHSNFANGSTRAPTCIVLVPGYFNSAIPNTADYPYFSSLVVDTIEAREKLPVSVVDTLSPVGSLNENAALLDVYLRKILAAHPDSQFELITHSAGGLYALKALTDDPTLPVQTVATLATPYKGVSFLDTLTADVPGLDVIARYLNLQTLEQFRRQEMTSFIPQLAIPHGIRWIAIAGELERCHVFDCDSIHHLSWVLSLSDRLGDGPSDGVVTVDSALANGVTFRDGNALPVAIETWKDFNFALEHWQMVTDSQFFKWLGLNPTKINQKQKAFIEELLLRLDTPPANLKP